MLPINRVHLLKRLPRLSTQLNVQRNIYTIKDIKYTAHAVAEGGGREGKSSSTDDKPLTITMVPPKELGGKGGGQNPEQLFALGYSSCFLGALKLVAGKEKKSSLVENAKVHATVNIGTPNEAPGFALSVKLEVENVSDESLVQAAHEACPYSRALAHGIDIKVGLKS